MSKVGRKLGRSVTLAAMCGLALAGMRPAGAQTITYPQWEKDSGEFFGDPAPVPLTNRYLALWEYYTGSDISRFNIWTNLGDPFNDGDDYATYYRTDTSGNITFQCPWGTRLFSTERPTRCVSGANGTTTGDDRPIANVLTLHVEDATATNGTGFTDYLYPDAGRAELAPPRAPLQADQGYYTPYTVPAAPTTTGPNLKVTQKTEFARDLIRYEVVVTNQGGTTRRVGARLLLDCYVDELGTSNINGQPAKSIYLPETQQRVNYETEFTGANMPTQWQMFDDDTGQAPNFIAKGVLQGNGATTPSRFIVGNTLDIYPFVLANTTYSWTTRPDFGLRIADIGTLIYWDPVAIGPGQSKSFVTYAGMGVADHGMSDQYIATHQGAPGPNKVQQGFVGAVQTPFALPLVNGNADVSNTAANTPLTYDINVWFQNEFQYSSPGAFAFVTLPDALKFPDGTTQSTRLSLGTASAVGSNNDEVTGKWNVQASGVEAGLVPINVTFGNSFGDSATAKRLINVPQGTLYQFGDEWRMVTFPFTFNGLQDDPAVALGFPAGTQFQIVRYNPANTTSNPYETVTQIEAGKSYWVRMLGTGTTMTRLQNATPVKLGITDNSGTNTLFRTPLSRGWNQVGDPSPYAVSIRDMFFYTPSQGLGNLVTYDTAVSQGWIRPTFYSYNRKTGQYVALNRNSIIQPGQGIWVYSSDDRVLAWPSPVGPKLSITP